MTMVTVRIGRHKVLLPLLIKYELSSIYNDYKDLDQFADREGHDSSATLIKCQHTWLKWLDGNADFVWVFFPSFDSVSLIFIVVN